MGQEVRYRLAEISDYIQGIDWDWGTQLEAD